MINKKFFQKLKEDYGRTVNERMQIIGKSNDVLHNAKRIIFMLHRLKDWPVQLGSKKP